MNRADKLLAVLSDGREHSRHDVFEAYGFMLTNNAAAELRARGYDVQHRRKDGVDTYKLAALNPDGFPPAGAGPILPEPSGLSASPTDGGETQDGDALIVHPSQLSVFA